MLESGPHNLEFLSLCIYNFITTSTLCVCLSYRSPSQPVSIFEDLCSTLHILGPVKYSRFLLIGDFNVDFCNEDCYLFSYITDILFLFSLTQIVPSYTHVSPNSNTSLIDLALLSDTNDLNHCCTIPPLSNSDHLGITISLKWIANTKHYSKFRCVWCYMVMLTSTKHVILSMQQIGNNR